MTTDLYRYYNTQSGDGLEDIGSVYKGRKFYLQSGRGFSSFFSSLWRYLQPLVHSGIDTLKTEALKTGSNILSDVVNQQKPLDQVLKMRGAEALQNLSDQTIQKLKRKLQTGQGYKKRTKRSKSIRRKTSVTKSHSSRRKKKKGKNIKKKKKASRSRKQNLKRTLDIFS
jgi:hypothetical protein